MGTLFTALGAAAALAGTDIIPVHQGGPRAVGLTGAQLLTYVGGSYVGKTGAQSMTGGLTIASGSLATSAAALTITQTWNGVGQRFDAVVMDFTNTNSGNSYPYLIRVNGSEISYLTKTGDLFCNNLRTISNSGSIGFSTAGNVFLYRDGDGQLAMRNGANAQRIHIYGTSDGTPGSNYQRMVLSANGTTGVTIAAEGLGTPTANQDLNLTPGGTGSVVLNGSVNKIASNSAFRNANSDGTGNLYLDVSNVVLRRGDAVSNFSMLKFNAATSAQAGIKPNGTQLQIRLADDSGDADVSVRNIRTNATTVASLIAAATAGAGARAFVTDANATTFLSTVAAGGANKVPVVSDGTNWLIG